MIPYNINTAHITITIKMEILEIFLIQYVRYTLYYEESKVQTVTVIFKK